MATKTYRCLCCKRGILRRWQGESTCPYCGEEGVEEETPGYKARETARLVAESSSPVCFDRFIPPEVQA